MKWTSRLSFFTHSLTRSFFVSSLKERNYTYSMYLSTVKVGFVADGLFDLFVVTAAIGQHQDLTPIIGANRVLQVQRAKICHHVLMFALRDKPMCLAI